MTKTSRASHEDPRPLPALGYCATCLRNGIWTPAVTLWTATGYCPQCLIATAGIAEHTRRIAEQTGDQDDIELKVVDLLRRDAPTRPTEPGM